MSNQDGGAAFPSPEGWRRDEAAALSQEAAALRARLARIEAAAKPIVQYIEYVDDPKTTLEAAQRAWSPYWREFRALRDAIAAEPTPLQNPEDKA